MAKEIKTLHPEELNPELCVIVGTRPGIVMFSPIIKRLIKSSLPFFSIHTGQHYSPNMDEQFFRDLELPPTDYRIEGVAERKTHAGQTAAMLEGVESILLERRPRLVLVGGDANTNLAGALAARKLHIQLGHIEAGERSYDWRMPEEHNRVIIDHISEHLFVTNEKSRRNLLREGIEKHIYVTGNPIVDASHQNCEIARQKSRVLERLNLDGRPYALMTSHREENVDNYDSLKDILTGVAAAGRRLGMPVAFMAHPRTLKRMQEFELTAFAEGLEGLKIHEAVGYLDFLNLLHSARLVFTDSGGVQQEACILNKPCVTLRDNTEWTETIEIGANRLAGCAPPAIEAAAVEALRGQTRWENPFGDGSAAEKICDVAARVISECG